MAEFRMEEDALWRKCERAIDDGLSNRVERENLHIFQCCHLPFPHRQKLAPSALSIALEPLYHEPLLRAGHGHI